MEDENRDIEEQIRSICDEMSTRMDQRILEDLFGRLQESEPLTPVARSAGLWRMIMNSRYVKLAAAAVVALAITLPVGYGAVKAIKKYFIAEDSVTFEYPEPNGGFSYTYSRSVSVASNDATTEQEARAQLEEFLQLYRQGKATEIEPGIWKATLSNGEEFAYGGNPENASKQLEFTEEEKVQLKQQADEINELRKAGKGERTFWKEVEDNGVRIRLYNVRYTLPGGQVVTICEGEEAK